MAVCGTTATADTALPWARPVDPNRLPSIILQHQTLALFNILLSAEHTTAALGPMHI